MIPAKPLDRAMSNIKYRLGKYYVRMGLTPSPKVRMCRDSSNPHPRDPYVINEWLLTYLNSESIVRSILTTRAVQSL